jgi:CRP-like cAMP-binding protein
LSQEELAHYLSVSRQIVNQHLQNWRKQGWVDLARGRIIIVDEDALDDVAMGSDSG